MRAIALLLVMVLSACSNATDAPPSVPEPPRFARASPDPVAHGERLSKVLGCSGCHGDDLTGTDWGDAEYGTLWSANLNRSAAAHSHAELAAMITAGTRPDRALMEMPSYLFTRLEARDLGAVVAYLKTLKPTGPVHPEPTIGPKLAEEIRAGTYRDSAQQVADLGNQWPPDLGEKFAFGRYIVRATCAECHKMDLRGDDPATEEPPLSVDLRIVASYDPADFTTLMRTGKAAGDRELEMMSGVARRRYANLTDDEVAAIRAYLTELAARDP